MYTLRHNLGMQVEYVVWADSEAEAREMAYRMYEQDEPADDVLAVIGRTPLYGDIRGATRWLVFFKEEGR